MAIRPVQNNYTIYPTRGYPGDRARPYEPVSMDAGVLYVPTSGRKPRPGDALYYDTARDAFALPTTAAQTADCIGILSYRKDTVASENADVEFDDGDEIQVGVFGSFWVVAGGTVKYGQVIRQDRTDWQWDSYDVQPAVAGSFSASPTVAQQASGWNTSIAAMPSVPIVCASRKPLDSGSAGTIIEARIGFGRIV